MKQPGRSITGDFRKYTVLVATASTVLVGLSWVAWMLVNFNATVDTVTSVYMADRREECQLAVRNFLEFIEKSRKVSLDNARDSLRERALEAWTVAEGVHVAVGEARTPAEKAEMIREILRPIRFNQGRASMFVLGLDGVGQLFPLKPEFEKRNLLEDAQADAAAAAEVIRVAREQGEGFVEYRYVMPGSPRDGQRRLVYVKEFKPLGWALGAGDFLDDIEADLRDDILQLVETWHFGKFGDHFVGTMGGVALTGPGRGTNLVDAVDVDGKPFIRMLIDTAASGGGFVEYTLRDFRGLPLNRRLSYVAQVPDWGWFLGAALSTDGLDRIVGTWRDQLRRDVLEGLAFSAVLLALVLVVQRLFARRMARRVAEGVEAYSEFFRRLGSGGASIDPAKLPYAEFVELAQVANVMAEARRRAVKELSDSEARYKRLVENVEDAIYLADDTGRFVDVNKEACDRAGFSREEMLARYVWDVDAVDTPDGFRRKISSYTGTGAVSVHSRHRRRDGSEYPVEIKIGLLRENGRVFSLGVARDISERLEAEQALRDSEEQFRSILESSPMGMHFYRLDEADQPILVAANAEADRLLGSSHAGKIGLPVEEAFPGMPQGAASDLIRAVVRGALPMQSRELPYADERISGIYEITLFKTGERTAASLFTDVSERKKMQELMVQTEKMMSVGGLAAGMAHEINNPLGGILQNVQVALRRLTHQTPANEAAARQAGTSFEGVREFVRRRGIESSLEMIRESGTRAALIVRSMLEFSRREESSNAPADLNALLDKAVELCATDYDLKHGYDFKKIRIKRDYDGQLPQVPCSLTQIQQVLLNLLRNAAQALANTPEPTITLRTRVEGGHVRVEVEDNGPGMDEAVRRKAFDPFFTTKPVGEGTGLGLSVSYFIVTSVHKGAIDVETSSGAGARFILRLPVRPDEWR